MTKIVLICGLPGSGKTTLAHQLASEHSNSLVIDDPSINGIQEINNIEDYDYVFIPDPAFCKTNTRIAAIQLLTNMYRNVSIKSVFFENNPEQCIKNSQKRIKQEPKKRVESYIQYLTLWYNIPSNSIVYEVFSDEES